MNTTRKEYYVQSCSLWFGYILLSLTYWIQRRSYLDVKHYVVIWLHPTIFDILNTTMPDSKERHSVLWFGYILLSLTYWIQPTAAVNTLRVSCDLVTSYYLWHIQQKHMGRSVRCDLVTSYYLWHIEYNSRVAMLRVSNYCNGVYKSKNVFN